MRRFFVVLSVSLFCFFWFASLSHAGPLRNLLRRVTRHSPIPSAPSCVCKPEPEPLVLPFVQEPVCQSEMEVPLSQPPSIALEPRPGTGLLPSLPGKLLPTIPDLLSPKQVPIVLDPTTQELLKSAGGKVDSFLSLASVVLAIFGGGHVLQWVVRAGGGLLPLILGLLRLVAAAQSGQPQPALVGNPVVPFSTPPPAISSGLQIGVAVPPAPHAPVVP